MSSWATKGIRSGQESKEPQSPTANTVKRKRSANVGRPPLEPRIAELEKQLKLLQQQVANLAAQNISRMIPSNTPEYQPSFDKWPGRSVA